MTGVTLTSPTPVTPTANQQFKYAEQPLTLTVGTRFRRARTALTYTFEVASDAAFATKVFSKDGVAVGQRTDVAEDRHAAGPRSQELLLARASLERQRRRSVLGGPRVRRRRRGDAQHAGAGLAGGRGNRGRPADA